MENRDLLQTMNFYIQIKPNEALVPTKNQTKEVDLPYEAEERRTIRKKLRLDSNNFFIEYLFFLFNAANTFFLTLCGLIYFSQGFNF